MRPKSEKDKEGSAIYFRASDEASKTAVRKVQELLGIDPKVREYNVVYGSFPSKDT